MEGDRKKGRITLVLGGARSGKSRFAVEKANNVGGRKLFIATAQPLDEEMRERIERHKRSRDKGWELIEEPIRPLEIIKERGHDYDVVLLDCLSLWLSNLIHNLHEPGIQGDEIIIEEIDSLISACKGSFTENIIVSNEVGLGIVPENKLARFFRDIIGHANQMLAKVAKEVYLLIGGIPMKLK